VADLEQAFAAHGLEPDVRGFLSLAAQQRWLVWD
jgi:pyrroloquinoline quinone biosynthesis protein D